MADLGYFIPGSGEGFRGPMGCDLEELDFEEHGEHRCRRFAELAAEIAAEPPERIIHRAPRETEPAGLCAIEGCDRLGTRHGLCLMHYQRQKRGVPMEGRHCPVCGVPTRKGRCPAHSLAHKRALCAEWHHRNGAAKGKEIERG
jgi:hypothetical protein